MAKKANIKSREAEVLYHCACCYDRAHDIQRAYKFYARANKILERADDFVLHAKVLKGLGISCGQVELFGDASKYLQRSLELLVKLGDKSSQVCCLSLFVSLTEYFSG